MIKGEDIKRLIPQRNPFIMVDGLTAVDDNKAVTKLTIRPDNFFINADGELAESGLIEHMAQSASALAGYQALKAGVEQPPVGLIGEVKHFSCRRRPCSGEQLDTVITFGFTFGAVTIADGVTSVDGEIVAEGQLKIFIQSA